MTTPTDHTVTTSVEQVMTTSTTEDAYARALLMIRSTMRWMDGTAPEWKNDDPALSAEAQTIRSALIGVSALLEMASPDESLKATIGLS